MCRTASKKQPYYVNMGEDSLMCMAGPVWTTYHGADGAVHYTYTILTVGLQQPIGLVCLTTSHSLDTSCKQTSRLQYAHPYASTEGCACGRLHNRMPVVLPSKEAQDAWLAPEEEFQPRYTATQQSRLLRFDLPSRDAQTP